MAESESTAWAGIKRFWTNYAGAVILPLMIAAICLCWTQLTPEEKACLFHPWEDSCP
jgi:hypothetical protein